MYPISKVVIICGMKLIGSIHTIIITVCLLLASALYSRAASGDLDTGFDPSANNTVNAIVVQPDGKILLGGNFTSIGGVLRSYIARTNADGTLDTGFAPILSSYVNCIAMQRDGKILIGGSFGTVNDLPRTYIARLNPDGTLDANFNPAADDYINGMILQQDGKVVLWGRFTAVNGIARNRVARLHVDGTLDESFGNPNVNASVSSVALQPDGKMLLGGIFSSVGGAARNFIARLNTDGTLDPGFNPGSSGYVTSLVVQADAKILVGGSFFSLGGSSRFNCARLNADGSLDSSFAPNVGGPVNSLALQADGKIVIGGYFFSFGDTQRYYIARVDSNGALDIHFDPSSDSEVHGLALQADGQLLLGGRFQSLGGYVTRNRIARLINEESVGTLSAPDLSQLLWNRDGAGPELVDVTFEYSTDNGLTWIMLGYGIRVGTTSNWQLTGLTLPTGAKLRAKGRSTGGLFNSSSGLIQQVSPVTLPTIGPVDAWVTTGTATTSSLNLNGVQVADGGATITERGFVYAVSGVNTSPEIGGTGVTKLIVSGNTGGFSGTAAGLMSGTTYSIRSFATNLAGVAYSAVTAVTTGIAGTVPGDLDEGFNPNVGGPETVYCMAEQADRKVVLGGSFTSISGVSRNNVARLNAGGTLDSGFNPNINGVVSCVAMLADGKMLLGGEFTTVGWMTRNRIARVNSDGSLDMSFNTDVSDDVYCMGVQADGKILLGGKFTMIGGVARNRIARLNADGSLDTTFNPNINGSVYCLVLQSDGKWIMGGSFTSVNGVVRNRIARIDSTGALDTTFNPNVYGFVYCLGMQADGRVLLGGAFNTVGGITRNNIARVNADGMLDSSFNPNANAHVYSMSVLADGTVVLGGHFTEIGGKTRNRVARMSSGGILDPIFDPNARNLVTNPFVYDNATVSGLVVQANGQLLLGGNFRTVGSHARIGIARVVNGAAADTLTVPDQTQVLWTRGGAAPELVAVTLDYSVDNGTTWTSLGSCSRVGTSANWQATGLTLPTGAKLRVTGRAAGGYYNGSSGLIRQVYPPVTPPNVGALTITELGTTTVAAEAVVVADGGEAIIERGFVYARTDITNIPQIGALGITKVGVSGTIGNMNVSLSGVQRGESYSIRAYAINSVGLIAYTDVTTLHILTAQQGWRMAHFGITANSGSAADSADFDSDGLANLLEWAAGLNPTTSSTIPSTTTRNGSNIEFIYQRSIEAHNAGVIFTVEWNDTLASNSWSTAGVTQELLSNNGTIHQMKATLPAGSTGQRFIRLRVTTP